MSDSPPEPEYVDPVEFNFISRTGRGARVMQVIASALVGIEHSLADGLALFAVLQCICFLMEGMCTASMDLTCTLAEIQREILTQERAGRSGGKQ